MLLASLLAGAALAVSGAGGVAGCEARANPAPGPVLDPAGPYYHRVWSARTENGVTLTGNEAALDHASVPDGVRAGDGRVLVYYVNGETGGTWVGRIENGVIEPIGPIVVDGVREPLGVVDPDARRLANGRIRLAYLTGFGPPGSGERAICLAESKDGVRFEVVARALAATEQETDPSVVRLGRGRWLLAISRGPETVLARSAGGKRFTRFATVPYGGVPELASLGGGRVRLYVCADGIVSYVSGDRGVTWVYEATVVAPPPGGGVVCDPSRVPGTDVFLYKTAPPRAAPPPPPAGRAVSRGA